MSVADWVAIVSGTGGFLVGTVGLAVAIRTNKVAQHGNRLAKAANDTATDAVGQAEEANRIAEDTNKLAEDANLIAQRALRNAQDDIPYNWRLKVEDDGSAVIFNDCGHRADQVTVVVDVGGEPVTQSGPHDVAAFGQITFGLQSTMQKHFNDVHRNPGRESMTSGVVFAAGGPGKPVETVFRAHLCWLTDNEVPRSDVVQEVVRHLMTPSGGIRRAKPRR